MIRIGREREAPWEPSSPLKKTRRGELLYGAPIMTPRRRLINQTARGNAFYADTPTFTINRVEATPLTRRFLVQFGPVLPVRKEPGYVINLPIAGLTDYPQYENNSAM